MSVSIPPHDESASAEVTFPTFTRALIGEFHVAGVDINGKRFYDAGARSAEPADPVVVNAIARQLEILERRKLVLTQKGVFAKNDETQADYEARRAAGTLLDVKAIQLALTDIPRMILKKLPPNLRADKVVRAHSSYGLKHHLEAYRANKRTNTSRGYITNGDFIMAMMLLGFAFTRSRNAEPNVNFRCASLMERVRFNPGTRKEYEARLLDEFDDTQQ